MLYLSSGFDLQIYNVQQSNVYADSGLHALSYSAQL